MQRNVTGAQSFMKTTEAKIIGLILFEQRFATMALRRPVLSTLTFARLHGKLQKMAERRGESVTNEQALARARKDVCRTELDLCHARNRNATQEEMAALEAKLEYRKFVMEAVEAYGSKGGVVSR